MTALLLTSLPLTAAAQTTGRDQEIMRLIELIMQLLEQRSVTNQGTEIPKPSVTLSANPTMVDNESSRQPITFRWQGTNVSMCTLFQVWGEFNIRELATNLSPTGVYQVRDVGWKDGDNTPLRYKIICQSVYQDGKDRTAEAELTISRLSDSVSTDDKLVEIEVEGYEGQETINVTNTTGHFVFRVRPPEGVYVKHCVVSKIYDTTPVERERLTFNKVIQDPRTTDYAVSGAVIVSRRGGVLGSVEVSCITREDPIKAKVIFNIQPDPLLPATDTYKITLNGRTKKTGQGSMVQAVAACRAFHKNSAAYGFGDVVECHYGQLLFERIDQWKG